MGLTGLEHLVSVPLGGQRELDLVLVDVIHLSNLLELLRCILEDGHLLIDGEHGLISRTILLHGHRAIDLNRPLLDGGRRIILDKCIFDEVIILGLVPLLRVLDLNPVEPANPEQLIALLLLLLDVFLGVS